VHDTDERPIEGVLNLDKPIGMSSMGVCSVVRGKLRAGGAPKRVKVGHGGTLDPLAGGVLVVLVGRATKRQDLVMNTDKSYRATVDLAHVSESSDLEHEPTRVEVSDPPDRARIDAALARFVGVIEQAPPAHSAVKIGGRRSYALARAGRAVEPVARPVRIDAIGVVSFAYPELVIDIDCGKGTYIRSLARDIGTALGTGGMLTGLVRTRVGRFQIGDARPLDDLPDPLDPWSLGPIELD